jgi:hypothetical protein
VVLLPTAAILPPRRIATKLVKYQIQSAKRGLLDRSVETDAAARAVLGNGDDRSVISRRHPMRTMNDTTPRHCDRPMPAGGGRLNAGALSAVRKLGAAALITALGCGLGCVSTPPCRTGDVAGATVTGARTAGEAVATGAKTAGEGVAAAGKTAGAWVEGGSDKADAEWAQGKEDTKAKAREGSAATKEEANVPICEN